MLEMGVRYSQACPDAETQNDLGQWLRREPTCVLGDLLPAVKMSGKVAELVRGQRIDLRKDHTTLRYLLVICYDHAIISLIILSHISRGLCTACHTLWFGRLDGYVQTARVTQLKSPRLLSWTEIFC